MVNAQLNNPHGKLRRVAAIVRNLESVSYDTLVSTPARIFIAVTFWLSGRTKVDGILSVNDTAYFLFRSEYDLPLVPYRLAAHLATYAEHLFPILLLIGLASRLSASALLVMTLVIQVFVYPNAWQVHLGWATALVFIIFRGPGALSIDHYLRSKTKLMNANRLPAEE